MYVPVVDHLKVFVNFSCFISEGPAAGSFVIDEADCANEQIQFPSFNQNLFYFLLHLLWQVRLYSFRRATRR